MFGVGGKGVISCDAYSHSSSAVAFVSSEGLFNLVDQFMKRSDDYTVKIDVDFIKRIMNSPFQKEICLNKQSVRRYQHVFTQKGLALWVDERSCSKLSTAVPEGRITCLDNMVHGLGASVVADNKVGGVAVDEVLYSGAFALISK